MLLERILEKNPAMVEAAVKLHQDGKIPTGSWLFDLDAIAHNAKAIAAEATRLGLSTYVMTKQIGRNPMVTAVALHHGLNKTVAVDIQCARLLHRYRIPVGHVGHLNQIPVHDIPEALAMRPDVFTVYSVEAARRISDAAAAMHTKQDLLLQVYRPGDVFFPGQEGGFRAEELIGAASEIQKLSNVRIVGVTSFPVLSYDFTGTQEIAFNPNMQTITESAERLRNELGIEITQINAPGNTSLSTLAMLREGGATHVEPGHGLTGTTPPQIVEPDHVEIPSYVFVTEVSHHYEGKAYGIAAGSLWALMGGFLDSKWRMGGLVGSDPKAALENRLDYEHLDQIIDYHMPLVPGDRARFGDTIVFPTYTQAHMTRAQIVPVSGISTGNPRVRGVFDHATTMLDRNWNPVAPNEVIRVIDELLEQYVV
jgi:predicted amino acid racemase